MEFARGGAREVVGGAGGAVDGAGPAADTVFLVVDAGVGRGADGDGIAGLTEAPFTAMMLIVVVSNVDDTICHDYWIRYE